MIKIVAIGKIKENSMKDMIAEYSKRMKSVHPIKVVELNNSIKTEVDEIVKDESTRILNQIDSKDYVILLDLKGKDISSIDLSKKIDSVVQLSRPLIFVIGGSHGVNEDVVSRSDFMWRLSKLTFPHQLVRILLFEQIYRAFMIKKNHPYHK